MYRRSIISVPFFLALGCGETADQPPPGNMACGFDALPEASVACTDPSCNATTGTKLYGKAKLDSAAGKDWVVPVWAVYEIGSGSDSADVEYGKAASGGLTAHRGRTERRRGEIPPEFLATVYTPERLERLAFERLLRSGPFSPPKDRRLLIGTAIGDRTDEILPAGVSKQGANCDAANPSSCGSAAICRIDEGMTNGTCTGALMIKFFAGGNTTDVAATVRKVGTHVAVVVDDANNNVSAADVDEIIRRFDTHVAPRNHLLFGEPRHNGRDRDGNGVVIAFLTERVAQQGASIVGYFRPEDMKPSAEDATSNAADLLYMRPPGGAISLNAISGTLAHEYVHLQTYYAKVIRNASSPEERWLDEGLATFAEDVAGYGEDSFKNVAAYLKFLDTTSLTGFGQHSNENDADSFERRGMAHLAVRYVFEQAGGATFPDGPGAVTDEGGVAAMRRIVDSPETGVPALGAGSRVKLSALMGDFITAVAIDGTALDCLPGRGFAAPEQDKFTMFQRGVDLRKTIEVPGGTAIALAGPKTNTLEMESVPIAANSGEIRTVSVQSGSVDISINAQAEAEYEIGFRAYRPQ